MQKFLVQLSLGPVQGFIATARRSRDLWFGSYILSEISKAAAHSLCKSGARLIFPSPNDEGKDLSPWSSFSVANVVTAELDKADLQSAKAALDRAKEAAASRWSDLCAEARGLIGDEGRGQLAAAVAFVRDDIWKAQLGDVVEVYGGIVPVTTYKEANKRLRALVANRKNTRDFTPYRDNFFRPKSSLDGAQSTVIGEASSNASSFDRLRRRLGIEPAEQLDTAGMVKRVLGRRRGFIPAARAAAEPWLERARRADPETFEKLKKCFAKLKELDLATGLQDFRYLNYEWIEHFPYDAQLLYPERIDVEHARALGEIQKIDGPTRPSDEAELNEAIGNLRRTLKRFYDDLGQPCPYYGLLLADGDRMGRLIDKATENGADAHRAISKALSEFAGKVPQRMSENGGACIYSGGDDVLGLVSLPKALACARALAGEFRECLKDVAKQNRFAEADWPTLSVGIVIAHVLEPLGDVRNLAVDAEKLAKDKKAQKSQQGNSLALLAKPRGGSLYRCRIRWDDQQGLTLLESWQTQLQEGSLPRGLPHELDFLWQRAAAIFDPKQQPADFAALWEALFKTALKKKRPGAGADGIDEALCGELLKQLTPAGSSDAANANEQVRARLDLMQAALWLSGRVESSAG